MKLIDSKPSFKRVNVVMYEGNVIFRTDVLHTKGSVHVLRKNFPRGVTPVAFKAYATFQNAEGNEVMVVACGLGLTESAARKDAKHELRKKLIKQAKKNKFIVSKYSTGYKITSPSFLGDCAYGYGETLDAALNNFKENLEGIQKLVDDYPKQSNELIATRRMVAYKEMKDQTLSYKTYKLWEKDDFDPAKKPTRKWKWYHWFYLPPL